MEIVMMLVSVLGVGGVVGGVVLRRIDKMEKKQDARENARAQESVLMIRGVRAVGHLAEAVAIAQKRGQPNGEMETAFEYYKAFNDDLNAFLIEQNAARNHRRG